MHTIVWFQIVLTVLYSVIIMRYSKGMMKKTQWELSFTLNSVILDYDNVMQNGYNTIQRTYAVINNQKQCVYVGFCCRSFQINRYKCMYIVLLDFLDFDKMGGWRGMIQLTGLTTPHVCACSNPEPRLVDSLILVLQSSITIYTFFSNIKKSLKIPRVNQMPTAQEGQIIHGKERKDKRINNDLQNITQKAKYQATRISQKTQGKHSCSGRGISSCLKCGTRCATLSTSQERGKKSLKIPKG